MRKGEYGLEYGIIFSCADAILHIVMSYMRYIWTAMHSSTARTSLGLLIVQQTGSCRHVYRKDGQWPPIACDCRDERNTSFRTLTGNSKMWKQEMTCLHDHFCSRDHRSDVCVCAHFYTLSIVPTSPR